jgi:putative nucleotidyltransferase with HDIG domain
VIGTHIGNYRIVTELGAGAMGEVYFAEHAVMGRRAAVKIIREELSGNAEMVERFANEARQVNRIGHPNIVEITDFGQVQSRYYIMMELLEGETLEERLERVKRIPPPVAQKIAVQIMAALAAAHELGVVHRDLKPENIYLVSRGGTRDFVKVLDFGIAKLMGLPRTSGATIPGMLLGTPHFMSPEQCQGAEQVDHRSDVYSLGVILYRMLTGELPFDSDTLIGVLYAHANNPPRAPSELCPEISDQLQAVVLKALAKAPGERFQTMAAFQAALEGAPLSAAENATVLQVDRPGGAGLGAGAGAGANSGAGAVPGTGASVGAVPGADAASPVTGDTAKNRRTLAHMVTAPVDVPGAAAAPAGAVAGAGSNVERASKPDARAVQGQANATDPAPAEPVVSEERKEADARQGQRVGSRLARILVERIHKNKLLLPAMPGAARECLRLVDDPNGGMLRVAAAIGRDPVIAPLVLRRARSALLGTHTPVKTIDQAVARLGSRQLRSILLDLCTRRLFESKNPAIRRATRGLWEHSLAVAILSRAIARRRRDVDPEAAYLAGLLHDVGKPVAASLLLEAERTLDAKPEDWLSKDVWLDVIQECHREVGVALARSWELQDDVVLAIARSQRYSVDGPGSIASVVCFANAIVKGQGIYTGDIDIDAVQALIREGLELFKIEAAQLDTLIAELQDGGAEDAPTSQMTKPEAIRRKVTSND